MTRCRAKRKPFLGHLGAAPQLFHIASLPLGIGLGLHVHSSVIDDSHACPVESASQLCETRRPNGAGNTPSSGSPSLSRRHAARTGIFLARDQGSEFGISRLPETGR